MYTGAALSFCLIRACRSGLVLYSIVLSDAGGENDGSSVPYLKHHYCIVLDSLYHNMDIGTKWHWALVSCTQSQSIGMFCVCAVLVLGLIMFSFVNRMAWQWAETLVEIRGTLADIRRTTKLGCNLNFPKHEFNRPVCLEVHHYLLAHLSQ